MSVARLSDDERAEALAALVGDDSVAIIQAATRLSSDRGTTEALLALLPTQTRAEVRQGILYALSWHADPRSWNLMNSVLSDTREGEKVRGQAAEGLAYAFHTFAPQSDEFQSAASALLHALRDPSPEVRYGALFALGATREVRFVEAIAPLLNDLTEVPGWGRTVSDGARDAIWSLEFPKRK